MGKCFHLNLKIPFHIPSFPGRENGNRLLSSRWLKSSSVLLDTFLVDTKGKHQVCPGICTMITISFSNRRERPHRQPRGPAWLQGFGSSPTHQICCSGASQCVQQFTGGEQSARWDQNTKTGAPGQLLPQLQCKSGRTLLRTVLAGFNSLLGLQCVRDWLPVWTTHALS
jgi:hypothetical protein